MFVFVAFALLGSASAGGVGGGVAPPLHGGHAPAPVVPGPPILLKDGGFGGFGHGHGGGLFGAPLLLKGGHHGGGLNGGFGGHPLPPLVKAGHGPVLHGPPVLLKGGGHGGFGGGLAHGAFLQGPPIFLKGHFGGGPVAHSTVVNFQPFALKGGHAGGHGGVVHGPVVHGPPVFLKGGSGHTVPLVKGGAVLQGPPVVVKGGHGSFGKHLVKEGSVPLKGGHLGTVAVGHEQHAVSGPSYLITTVHHVQKVSPGGKLIASFAGHGAALGGPHGGVLAGKHW